MQLEGKNPLGIFQDIGSDQRDDGFALTPFRLQKQFAIGLYFLGKGGCPLEIRGMVNDNFEFIGPGNGSGQRGFEFFWRQADPVPFPTERVGTGGFYMGLKTRPMQFPGQ